MLPAYVVLSLYCLTSPDIEILRAALVGRVQMGVLRSLGSDQTPPLTRLCVGGLDGKDLPGDVLKSTELKHLTIYPLSRCPSDLAGSDFSLRLGRPQKTSTSRVLVQWRGLGNDGVLAVCRRERGWKACGSVAPIVGDFDHWATSSRYRVKVAVSVRITRGTAESGVWHTRTTICISSLIAAVDTHCCPGDG
jgi:hypothetical protein